MDTTKNIMLLPTLETFAAQAQVFASAWALMGGPFDSGDGLELAEVERGILLDMARRMQEENEALRAQAQTCGAGAGCCAQAARIAELEAQLEAVGAGGVGPLMAAAEQPAAPEDSAVFDFWRADHMPQSDKSEAWAEWCALRSTRLAPQQAAQAQDDAVAQAVAVEREACAQLAA